MDLNEVVRPKKVYNVIEPNTIRVIQDETAEVEKIIIKTYPGRKAKKDSRIVVEKKCIAVENEGG